MKDNKGEAQEAATEPKEGEGRVITTKINVDPRLNRASPDFDPVAYQAALDARGGMNAMLEGVRVSLEALTATLEANMPPTEFLEALANHAVSDETRQAMEILVYSVSDLAHHLSLTGLTPLIEKVAATIETREEEYRRFLSAGKEKGTFDDCPTLWRLAEGMTFIEAAVTSYFDLLNQMGDYLEAELSKPEYEGLTMPDMMQPFEGNPEISIWERAINQAEEAMMAAEPDRYRAMMEARGQQAGEPPRINARPPEKIDYPLDKVNATVWRDLGEALKEGGGQLAFAMERRGSKKEATLIYSINFDDLEKLEGLKITKALTSYDKRVYTAAGAIYNQGGDCMSAGQIYTAMGGRGKPATSQLQRIGESLTKMGAARIYIDNTNEITVNKNYPKFVYDAPLLPFERISAYINGTLTDNAIHLFREPPLLTFAKGRKQVTTVTRQLLEMPLSHTEENLQLEDYLIERIAAMKKPRSRLARKILFNTIYEACGITGKTDKEKKSRQRLPAKACTILDHFKEHGMIKGYTKLEDGIQIAL